MSRYLEYLRISYQGIPFLPPCHVNLTSSVVNPKLVLAGYRPHAAVADPTDFDV